jgi:hypothetical protein
LVCIADSCEPPECLTDDDCGLFQMCYSNICQKMPPVCTNDRNCKLSMCSIRKNASMGICSDCSGKCPAQMCKYGFCEKSPKCLVEAHCDEYHECKETCVPKPCSNCPGRYLP